MPDADHSTTAGSGRLPVLAAVAALLAGGVAADQLASRPVPAPGAAVEASPVAAPAAALSSTWLCAGAPAGGGQTDVLQVANAGDAPVTAQVTLVAPSGPQPPMAPVRVPPKGAVTIPEAVAGAAWVAAEVAADGGAVAVGEAVVGPKGTSASPCATSGSSTWYFATGETAVNADQTLSLLNPYGADTIVDLSFSTDQGTEAPGDFTGIDVPPRGLVEVDLASHLRRRGAIATTVHARSGRVVATTTEQVTAPTAGEAVLGGPSDPANPTSADPADPAPGTTITLGAAAPSTSGSFTDGEVAPGLAERYTVYNPSGRPADVRLDVRLDQGVAQPFTFTVAAGQATTIDAGTQARITPGVGHAADFEVTNGVGVVAARTVVATAPGAPRGRAALVAGALTARSWLVPFASAPDVDGSIAVVSAAPTPEPVTVTLLGASGAAQTLTATVPAGGRTVVGLPAPADGIVAALVQAGGPVAVQATESAPALLYYSLQEGVPLS